MTTEKPDMLVALAAFAPGQSTLQHYDAWADDYERDLLERCGYSAHRIAADAFAQMVQDRTASIIDIGCGTGLVGVELAGHGFETMDGLDISVEMMAHARAKGVYRDLIAGNVMTGTGLADQSHDAAICVGSFAPGHLGPAALDEIVRLVRTGGAIVIFMNAQPYEAENYQSHVDRLAAAGQWSVQSIETINYMDKLDRPGKLIRARRL